MVPNTFLHLIAAITALLAVLTPLLAELRRWRRPPGSK
jgi:hypothetical protein